MIPVLSGQAAAKIERAKIGNQDATSRGRDKDEAIL
jgi:hypothetical protein